MRKEITEEQITELMAAIPRAEEVDRLREENRMLRAEIERLQRAHDVACEGGERLHAKNNQLRLEIDLQHAEIERLREALKPFALEAKAYDPPEGDDEHPAWASRFTCGNLRDARNALEGKP